MSKDEQRKVRRYSAWLTALLIVGCNGLFLLGIWVSGVNLDRLIRIPDIYNPLQDICLQLRWHRVEGQEEPVRLCSEWVQLSDPSGQTHTFQRETKVVKGADGKLYFDHGARVDYRLLLFVMFVLAILVFGVMLQRYLIARYRVRLETAASRSSLVAH